MFRNGFYKHPRWPVRGDVSLEIKPNTVSVQTASFLLQFNPNIWGYFIPKKTQMPLCR